MGFRNMSAWAIRNPVVPLVLFMALTLAGIISFNRMQVNDSPEITFPAVYVQISQPGAAPTEIETQITTKVEAAIRGLEGVDEINSTISEGSSGTFIQFDFSTPVDRAVTDVRDAVASVRSELPDGVIEPRVERVIINDDSIATWSVEGTDTTMEGLSEFVDTVVVKRLLGIPGMQKVDLSGGVDRAIRVILDPAKMQSLGITASQVNSALRNVNQNAAGGQAEIGGSQQSLRIVGSAKTAYEVGQLQIPIAGNQIANGGQTLQTMSRMVKLADIAQIRDTSLEQKRFSKVNGHQVVGFGIQRARGASEVALYDATVKELAKIEKENPKFRFIQQFTSVDYTKAQYKSAVHALLEGAILAVVVVFLFLRDGRATVISALAIPLSAIPTFWIMSLMGFSLNFMTLLALSLVAGVLVDDAIVEIENIVRHMRMGKTAYQASIDAADEIGLAVVATTFSIVAVFLPVGLMPGIAGQFFKNFGITVVVAVLMSLAVARLITPMVAAYFLKAHGHAEHGEGKAMDVYMAILRWTLRNRWWTMAIGGLAFLATIGAFATLPFTFQPPRDNDFSRVSITMTPGTTLAQTEAVTSRVADILRQQQEVRSAVENVRIGNASIAITLKKDRKRSSIDFERETAVLLNEIPDARINFGGGGGGGRAVSLMLAGADPDALMKAANTLANEMRTLPNLRAPRVEGDLPRPELVITPRLDLAADLGVTTAALSQTIRIATQGEIAQNAAKFSLPDRQIPIGVALDEYSRRNLSTIQNLPVQTSRGGTVPLRVVAEIGFGAGPSEIRRFNQERRIMIGADLAPGAIAGEERSKIMELPIMKNLPQGVHYAASGEAKWQAEMIQNFVIAVFAGVLLVLAVLILLYRRAMPPFVNLGSLLLAPLGGAIALHLCGMPISLPVLIGLLMLLGIVAKNSILLIDFALEEMRVGVPPLAAILDAGHKRAQPIVMTTVAMIAGMIPTALALGGDGSFNQPMAVTVIGGLFLSTILTLCIVPASFSLAIGMEEWIGPKLGRRLLTYRPGDEDGPVIAGPSAPTPLGAPAGKIGYDADRPHPAE
ncbi:efflux RND transporter permease subunit [Sphingomonas sp. Leaf343]|uniref:efflux RND transporter permease subunit n=1 Tax=Sphingomonas sp. Leaf343 TaxID=1736345 RepID=UPI0006F4E4D8|nr:efflux RND transporter permease subunit [Sphingomonas sp. Leaf343]KQR87497.1 ABC transporter permease [Sphingomonas sp. Leaf343]